MGTQPMRPAPTSPVAFTIVELLVVIAVMAILAAIAIPHFQPPMNDQLQGAASVVAADLDYARSLAVTNNSTYRVDFSVTENRYVLTHVGSNAALDTLPATPFRPANDAADEHSCDLDRLPHVGATVQLHAVYKASASPQPVTQLEFGPLGGTTRPEATVVWLRCGVAASRRFLPITVDPVTGVASIGELQASLPEMTATTTT
jgi:prepilin-type N-terminal cleavage/methylation domain-containing protein